MFLMFRGALSQGVVDGGSNFPRRGASIFLRMIIISIYIFDVEYLNELGQI